MTETQSSNEPVICSRCGTPIEDSTVIHEPVHGGVYHKACVPAESVWSVSPDRVVSYTSTFKLYPGPEIIKPIERVSRHRSITVYAMCPEPGCGGVLVNPTYTEHPCLWNIYWMHTCDRCGRTFALYAAYPTQRIVPSRLQWLYRLWWRLGAKIRERFGDG